MAVIIGSLAKVCQPSRRCEPLTVRPVSRARPMAVNFPVFLDEE